MHPPHAAVDSRARDRAKGPCADPADVRRRSLLVRAADTLLMLLRRALKMKLAVGPKKDSDDVKMA